MEDYYKLIDCETIDIVNRDINGNCYDIICDDEGTFKENPRISAIDDMWQPMLVGNLIICGTANEEGNMIDLSDKDIDFIMENIKRIPTRNYPEGNLMLCKMAY